MSQTWHWHHDMYKLVPSTSWSLDKIWQIHPLPHISLRDGYPLRHEIPSLCAASCYLQVQCHIDMYRKPQIQKLCVILSVSSSYIPATHFSMLCPAPWKDIAINILLYYLTRAVYSPASDPVKVVMGNWVSLSWHVCLITNRCPPLLVKNDSSLNTQSQISVDS